MLQSHFTLINKFSVNRPQKDILSPFPKCHHFAAHHIVNVGFGDIHVHIHMNTLLGRRLHWTFWLKTWCLDWTAASSGHLDDTTRAVLRHVMFFFCYRRHPLCWILSLMKLQNSCMNKKMSKEWIKIGVNSKWLKRSNLSFWILHFCGWHIWAAPVPCRLALHGSGSGTADTAFSLQLGCQGLCQVQSCADMNREE